MNGRIIACIVFTLAALTACLTAYNANVWALGVLFKMLASCGFLATAVAAGALRGVYGRWILAGLFFSWWGDLFLADRHYGLFLWGLIAFWLAHACYCVAYWGQRARGAWLPETAVLLAALGVFVYLWLGDRVPADLRIPVIAYIVVISAMVGLAMATQGRPGGRVLVWGAILFYFSDLFVARQKFVESGAINGLIGLPLYYTGQLFLAASIAYVRDRRDA